MKSILIRHLYVCLKSEIIQLIVHTFDTVQHRAIILSSLESKNDFYM